MEVSALVSEIRKAWRPPPKLNLSDWADTHAILSAESSAEVGRWRTIPYQKGIMDAITDRGIESVTVMKSARVGWTKIINHAVGYHMHQDPCTVMVVQPTIGDAEGYSVDEIAPMIRDTKVLTPLVADPRTRDGGNTRLLKMFPGGSIRMVGADSPRGFRRVSIRFMAMDELDGYAPTAGEEGDQIKLAIRRTEYFWNRKILCGSTPTLDSTSRIKRRFEMGDQRYYFVPCPHCQHMQSLKWLNLRWEKGKPETVRYHCEGCGVGIEYKHQRWMVENGEWRSTVVSADPRHASFHIWAAYSYSPNASWAQLVKEWLESHKNIEERKTFINTVLGETYKGEGDAPDWKKLYDRREIYETGTVPMGGLMLFCGVDFQKDRIEAEVVAYGRNMESWSVDYIVIPGDTTQLDGPSSPFHGLDKLLQQTFKHESGADLSITMMALDTGYNTNTIYQYARSKPVNRVIAVDGRDSYAMLIGQPKAMEVNVRGKKLRRGVKLWPVGSSKIKTELYGFLKQEKPTDESGDPLPYGYCHFPQYGEEYFKGITAEEIMVRLVKGFRRYQWEKVREQNEPIDCRVYARAVASLAGVDRMVEDDWLKLEADLSIGVTRKPTAGRKLVQGRKSKISKDPYL
jgi:phage terminase large subunit GpA-like protein